MTEQYVDPYWFQDKKYYGTEDRKLRMWLETGALVARLDPDETDLEHKVSTIQILADIELDRIKPRNW